MNATQPEQWRPIPGYEGVYEASDGGSIRSIDRIVFDSNGRKMKYRGRIRKTYVHPKGYLYTSLCIDGQTTSHKVHQLVLSAFTRPRNPGEVVRHRNGDPADNRLTNLAYGTPAENSQDSLRHGTHNQRSKTHCPRGHAYVAANTYDYGGRRGRHCRACTAARTYVRRHGSGPQIQEIADRFYAQYLALPGEESGVTITATNQETQ